MPRHRRDGGLSNLSGHLRGLAIQNSDESCAKSQDRSSEEEFLAIIATEKSHIDVLKARIDALTARLDAKAV